MKQKQIFARPALGLLMAAAALPATPLLAQLETVPSPPPIDVVPAPVESPTPVVTTPPPAATTPAPVITTPVRTTPPPAAVVAEPVEEAAPPRRTARSTTQRTVTRTRTAAPVREAAPTAPIAEAPIAVIPPAAEAPVETLPVETLPVETVAPAAEPANDRALWPFVALGAALLVAILALFAWRRRRTAVYDEVYDEPVYTEELIEPAVAAPAAFVAAPRVAEAVAAGEPELEFFLKPSRAGVGDENARVDFDLEIANRGTGAARDVRVSAWMLGDGSPHATEAESTLIERVDIEAGEDANVEASVALPRSGFSEDSIVPVVVAEARFLRPDGSEGRATASYAVGVPDGDSQEMIHFDVENPSGLHEGVVAREVDTFERA